MGAISPDSNTPLSRDRPGDTLKADLDVWLDYDHAERRHLGCRVQCRGPVGAVMSTDGREAHAGFHFANLDFANSMSFFIGARSSMLVRTATDDSNE
ncbi:hypothetical protein STA1M1_37690 [Sinisalibacter aestuarii]|uniref:Uncharacterized protein n=1 Tax=Sinisalibacter aestuarii TaxID=2949426 RepID=A0ABQ5LY56_9RHOB|nr:hypothetical protein STA1M1_37690 [Sinisalibacter aestuarii]